MTPRLYPECSSYRGFGWELGPKADRFRVLGNDGQRARVQYLMRGDDRPRAWLDLTDPWLRGVAKWIATGPAWANPETPQGDAQGQLFRQK